MQRNDRRSVTAAESRLIRVGQHLWAIYKKECGESGNVGERQALSEALQQVWDLKKELQRELKAERAVQAVLVPEWFEKAKLQLAGTLEFGLQVKV